MKALIIGGSRMIRRVDRQVDSGRRRNADNSHRSVGKVDAVRVADQIRAAGGEGSV